MRWLKSFAEHASRTDQFEARPDQTLLLATGLFGEIGSVLAELKKMEREGAAYPRYRSRLTEELGDSLWYFIRLLSKTDGNLLDRLSMPPEAGHPSGIPCLDQSVALASSAGEILRALSSKDSNMLRAALTEVWNGLVLVSNAIGVSLEKVSNENLAKTQSRWPMRKEFQALFDETLPKEEQLPRSLSLAFLERRRGARLEVLLRYEDVNIGDRLTDNISDPDGYRYHDVFHLAYAVFTGWSPVTRALLRCKRKSRPEIDENQDGARAMILEEAISAVVFSRAKMMKLFEGITHVDYDLLKNIQEFVRGYEVESVPIWQWEVAILHGFRLFRALCSGCGGIVSWDLAARTMEYRPPIQKITSGGNPQ